MKYAIRFPISDGAIAAGLKSGLTADWSALTVQPKMPSTKTRRMITIRNDSGPQFGVQSRRRYGFNVWADSSVDAENLALDAMSVLRTLPAGDPITAIDEFNGPFEIEDDPSLTVGNKNLTHYYFSARVSVRATNS